MSVALHLLARVLGAMIFVFFGCHSVLLTIRFIETIDVLGVVAKLAMLVIALMMSETVILIFFTLLALFILLALLNWVVGLFTRQRTNSNSSSQ